ncbi:hypothetical protein LTR53_016967 [Teratosphaeriaceae sp. CCFEE 6253]|nr:hypothetical protein LTR53_016967 [Teratosphaeriaceae sp. CCFEE 6253]
MPPQHTEILEGSPPYMHTRYLTTPEQSQCLQNPTYAAHFAAIKALRQDFQYAQIALDISRRTGDASKRQLEVQAHELRELEDRFTVADDALAALAEVLVVCPVFLHTEAGLANLVRGKGEGGPKRLKKVQSVEHF